MENKFFNYFYEATSGFVFSSRQKHIPDYIQGDAHAREIKWLMRDVRKMAIKKSFQLPELFAANFDRDDWVQLAVIIMFQCCEKYDGKRPFDHFVRFMVSRRLQDQHRSLMRKNPPTDGEVLLLYGEIKKTKGDRKALQVLADKTGRSIEQLREIISSGVGQRIFTAESQETIAMASAPESLTPARQAESNELQDILFDCIDKLEDREKSLFLRHEMEGVSLKNLFSGSCYTYSFATFKRKYKSDIFEKVQRCVTSRVST